LLRTTLDFFFFALGSLFFALEFGIVSSSTAAVAGAKCANFLTSEQIVRMRPGIDKLTY
jgi:hypothetical protein